MACRAFPSPHVCMCGGRRTPACRWCAGVLSSHRHPPSSAFLQRIRTPLTPEILKSSMSWTIVSLLGSLGSLSRTWSKRQGAMVAHPLLPAALPRLAAGPAHTPHVLSRPSLLGRASWRLPSGSPARPKQPRPALHPHGQALGSSGCSRGPGRCLTHFRSLISSTAVSV